MTVTYEPCKRCGEPNALYDLTPYCIDCTEYKENGGQMKSERNKWAVATVIAWGFFLATAVGSWYAIYHILKWCAQ